MRQETEKHRVVVVAAKDQQQRWLRAAEADRYSSLSEWLRRTLDREADRVLEQEISG